MALKLQNQAFLKQGVTLAACLLLPLTVSTYLKAESEEALQPQVEQAEAAAKTKFEELKKSFQDFQKTLSEMIQETWGGKAEDAEAWIKESGKAAEQAVKERFGDSWEDTQKALQEKGRSLEEQSEQMSASILEKISAALEALKSTAEDKDKTDPTKTDSKDTAEK